MNDAVAVDVQGGYTALVSPEDAPKVLGLVWRPLIGHNGKVYATARTARTIYMHRLIAGTPKGMETDHVNGDGLDNRPRESSDSHSKPEQRQHGQAAATRQQPPHIEVQGGLMGQVARQVAGQDHGRSEVPKPRAV